MDYYLALVSAAGILICLGIAGAVTVSISETAEEQGHPRVEGAANITVVVIALLAAIMVILLLGMSISTFMAQFELWKLDLRTLS